jgi:cyclase
MEQLSETIWIHSVSSHGFTVTAGVVLGSDRVFVFDTLDSPQAMQPVRDLLDRVAGERRVIVVNSHHHWDHVYGNAAFVGCDIVAHRSCRRLIIAQGQSDSEKIPLEPPEGVPLPSIGFGDRVRFNDETSTVHLIRTPGHTADSIILYVDEQDVLFGGDTVEWPFPSLAMRDGEEVYLKTLRQLNQLPVKRVVPSHGPVKGKEIVDANQRYVEDLYETVRTAKQSGIHRGAIDLPVEAFLPPGTEVDETYRAMHRENIEWAYDEI